jgi:DNA primase
VRLTRAGREHKACCPFHHEKTPSFTVNDDKGFYHCFGCGAHGDVIRFLMEHDKMGFLDAVGALAAIAGLEVPKLTPEEARRAREERSLHDLMEAAAGYFEGHLTGAPRDYLAGRGLSDETLRAFRVGYAPADGAALPAHLTAQGFTAAQVVEAGLARPSTRGAGVYAFFRDRVVFPVTDMRGRVIAFGGRVLPGAPGDAPKYLNSPDTPLFDKARTLFAARQARAGAQDGHSVVVVEGYMDAIACHAAGFRGAVAPMGTALTEAQMAQAWALCPDAGEARITLCFDGDEAGRRAAARAVDRALPLLGPGREVRIAFLPDGADPDSLIRSGGASALAARLRGAQGLVDVLWAAATAGRDLSAPEARAGVKTRLLEQVGRIADSEVAAHYRAAIRARVGQAFFANRRGKTTREPGLHPPGVAGRAVGLAREHGALVAAVVNHPHIYAQVDEALGQLPIADSALDALRAGIISALEADPDLDAQALEAHLRGAGHGPAIDTARPSVYLCARFAAPGADPGGVGVAWLRLAQNHESVACLHAGEGGALDALREGVGAEG